MSERKINLEEILWESFNKEGFTKTTYSLSDAILDSSFTEIIQKVVKEAMKEACRQTLELAAENAKAWCYAEGNEPEYGVDSQSILNTINQIE